MSKAFTACMLLCAMCGIGQAGTTYYVAPTGSDKNAGTSEQPFATIQKAADLVNPGDNVIVRDGTYTGAFGQWTNVVNITRGGTSDTNRVTFKSEHKWGAKVYGQRNTANPSILGTYRGFALGASYVTVEGFDIYDFDAYGIDYGGQHNRLLGNRIHDIGNSLHYEGEGWGQGIFENQTARYNVIDANVIYNIAAPPPASYHCHAMYLCGDDITITNNVMYNIWGGYGIQFAGYETVSNALVSNNTFAWGGNAHGTHIVLWPSHKAISNVTIQNNIFYYPQYTNAIASYDAGVRGVTVRNNLVYGEWSGSPVGLYNAVPGITDGGGNIIQQNPDFVAAPGHSQIINERGNPKVADMTKKLLYDFHLTPKSAAIGKGIADRASDRDHDGKPRPQGKAIDIGAFQR